MNAAVLGPKAESAKPSDGAPEVAALIVLYLDGNVLTLLRAFETSFTTVSFLIGITGNSAPRRLLLAKEDWLPPPAQIRSCIRLLTVSRT